MISLDFHRAESATAEIASLGQAVDLFGNERDMGHVLRIAVKRQGERETFALTMFGELTELQAICRAIGAAAEAAVAEEVTS